jgi:hypothetical protein
VGTDLTPDELTILVESLREFRLRMLNNPERHELIVGLMLKFMKMLMKEEVPHY